MGFYQWVDFTKNSPFNLEGKYGFEVLRVCVGERVCDDLVCWCITMKEGCQLKKATHFIFDIKLRGN